MSLKVLHCIHSLVGGGAERQLTILANNSNSYELQHAIFCVNAADSNIDQSVTRLYKISNKAHYPWKMLGEIRAAIRDYKPDVVHCWLPVTLIAPGLLAAKLEGVPAITSYRNAKKFNNIKDIAEFVSAVMLSKGVASNNNPKQSNLLFRWLYQIKKSAYIPNAISVPEEYHLQKSGNVNDVLTLLFVGRLVEAKNWKTLLLAVSKIDTSKKFRLLVCGSGEDDKVIDFIDEYHLSDRVELLGFRKDVYSIMAKSDLMILPSWNEGMPNVVLEAMSIGLPCVVSDIPAHTLLFKSEPVVEYFSPASSDELAALITEYLEGKKDLTVLAKNGFDYSRQFTVDRFVNEYSQYYSELVNK